MELTSLKSLPAQLSGWQCTTSLSACLPQYTFKYQFKTVQVFYATPKAGFQASVLSANVTNTMSRIIVALEGISRQPAFEASNRRYLPT